MKKEETIDVLNSLITINNDRIEGYRTASDATEEHDLINLFGRFISTSEQCKTELVNEVQRLGGDQAEGTKTSGKFFRVWMDMKAALTGRDRKAILNSYEYGEDQAQKTYENALSNYIEHLNPEQQTMVKGQRQLLEADHDHIKALRDSLVDA